MNTPVSFELAKILKEKGFDKLCSNFYTNPRCKMFGIDEHGRYYPIKNKAKTLWISGHAATLDSKHVCYAPTIAEAVMWLNEKYGIWIVVDVVGDELDYPMFIYKIVNLKDPMSNINYELHQLTISYDDLIKNSFNSPTKAYENAIKYVLTNLI